MASCTSQAARFGSILGRMYKNGVWYLLYMAVSGRLCT
jgi:hypothetical protein